MNSERIIVYVVTDPLTANIFGYDQIKFLLKNNDEIYLICGPGELRKDYKELGIKVIQVKSLRRNISLILDLISLFRIMIIIRKVKPYMAIYSTPKASLITSIACYLCRTPVRINQLWGARWQTKSKIMRGMFIKLEKTILFISTDNIAVSKSLKQLYGSISDREIHLLANGSATGVNTKIFYPTKPKSIEKNCLTVGFIGRIAKDKGIEELLVVFDQLKMHFPGIKLQVLGNIDLADPVAPMHIKKISLDPAIAWIKVSNSNEIARYVRKWDLHIFPSKREGFGTSIIEASASGVPTIAWDIVGVRDAIPPNLNKLLVPGANLDRFFRISLNYLKKPISERERFELSNWTKLNFDKNFVLSNFSKFIEKKVK
jgi:glycosyltransferase involved in cell wall biosynthesis